jgi:hypothetical protein
MTRIFPLAVLLLTLSTSARAEDLVIAQLWANSGSLPPPYAWNVEVTVTAEGWVTVTRCTGYKTEGPACRNGEGAAIPGVVDAILRAAEASDLANRPATALDPPMVGGGWTSGTVMLGDRTIDLIAQPIAADEPRVATVLEVIGAAIPEALLPILEGE